MGSELTITDDQLKLIRNSVAKGSTDAELKLYLYDCARHGVHPLDQKLYFTVRTDKHGNRKYTPITSIDFMREKAGSTFDYVGNDDPIFEGAGNELIARVTVWRSVGGQRCAFTATARWSEYVPPQGQDHMWRKMPYLMLGKCAEALALRKGFPKELHGLYAAEEMAVNRLNGAPEFDWKRASKEDRTDHLLSKVLMLDSEAQCAESLEKLKPEQVGQENYQRIHDAIEARRKQLHPEAREPGQEG